MPDTKKLPDLAEVIKNCKNRIDAIDTSLQVTISSEKADSLMDSYKKLNPKHSIELVGGHTFAIGTGEQTRHISIQETTTLAVLAENLRALESFRVSLDDIAHDMGFSSRTGDGSNFFKTMPSEDWQSKTLQKDTDKFLDSMNNVFKDQQNRERMLKFVSDPDWSGMRGDDGKIGRKLDRSTDWQESAVLKTGALVAAAHAGRVNLIRAIEKAGFGADLVENKASGSSTIVGENVIFYGAPGTGKSYTVNNDIKAANREPIRTVFHPDLQNSDFFGCLKPKMDGEKVKYEFSEGPFMKALEAAYKTPSEPVYLVIEELNRAAAAAVFGDLFLLLDRDDNGASEYGVSFPSTESQDWFSSKTGLNLSELRVPPNLFIYATMNSADQGVYPIDTAFRRRWQQVYLPLKYDEGTDGEVSYVDAEEKRHELTWRKFVELLNEHLTSSPTLDISEDRLLGQWFVKKKELDGNGIPEKVLLYLWDDLLRHEDRAHVFHSGAGGTVKTYGHLVIEKQEARRFLSDRFLQLLNKAANGKPNQKDDTGSDAP